MRALMTFELESDEVFAVALRLQVFRDLGVGSLAQGADTPPDALLRKLRQVLTKSQQSDLDSLATYIVHTAFHDPTDGWIPWDPDEPWTGPKYEPAHSRKMLQKAVAQNKDIEMEYFTHSRGEFTKRHVTPLKINGPYFIGHCHERDEERTFRIDRIADIRLVKAGRRRAKVSSLQSKKEADKAK